MKKVQDIGEFRLIERIRRFLPSTPTVVEGVGDDCAVIRVYDHLMLVSCDLSIEGVHFRRDLAKPEDIGWKVAAASLSDVAAMGGTPLFCLTSLSVPGDTPVLFVERLYQGITNLLSRFGAVVIGGDTTRTNGAISLDITVIGEVTGHRFLRRRGAQIGDKLTATGRLGRSRCGLHALLNGHSAPALTESHMRPKPRVLEGLWLSTRPGIHAMLDVSDGLVQDAGHLARASGLGIDIDPDKLPLAPEHEEYCAAHGLDSVTMALQGGEDYELLFAMDSEKCEETLAAFHQEFRTPITMIGEFTDAWSDVRIRGEKPAIEGYDHFSPTFAAPPGKGTAESTGAEE